MRLRSWLIFLLPLFLLFSQQALVLHELGHHRLDRLMGHEQQGHAPGHQACDKCVSLAPLSGAVTPGLLPLILAEFGFSLLAGPLPVLSESGRIGLHNRGPPVSL